MISSNGNDKNAYDKNPYGMNALGYGRVVLTGRKEISDDIIIGRFRLLGTFSI